MPFSQIRSHAQVLGVRTWTYLLGATIEPIPGGKEEDLLRTRFLAEDAMLVFLAHRSEKVCSSLLPWAPTPCGHGRVAGMTSGVGA